MDKFTLHYHEQEILNSLVIKNLCFNSIKCHPRALQFYDELKSMQDAISEVENSLSELFDDDF